MRRPPAPNVEFEVDVWVRVDKLSEAERIKYLPASVSNNETTAVNPSLATTAAATNQDGTNGSSISTLPANSNDNSENPSVDTDAPNEPPTKRARFDDAPPDIAHAKETKQVTETEQQTMEESVEQPAETAAPAIEENVSTSPTIPETNPESVDVAEDLETKAEESANVETTKNESVVNESTTTENVEAPTDTTVDDAPMSMADL